MEPYALGLANEFKEHTFGGTVLLLEFENGSRFKIGSLA